MNEFDLISTILSEQWFITLLFLLWLYWVYKLATKFTNKYLEITQENHRLERERQEAKDLKFLQVVNEIATNIKESWVKAEWYHNNLESKIQDGHEKIHNKLDKIHDNVSDILRK